MAIERVSQTIFTHGEIGSYLSGRFDDKIYSAGAQTLENWLLLPQGGVMRKPGFQYVDTLTFDLASVIVLVSRSHTMQPTITFTGGGSAAAATAIMGALSATIAAGGTAPAWSCVRG
jgi:hypothetical protein